MKGFLIKTFSALSKAQFFIVGYISVLIFIATFVHIFTYSNLDQLICTSDFVQLYYPTRMLADGKLLDLYDQKSQKEYYDLVISTVNCTVQQNFLAYRNPPITALLLSMIFTSDTSRSYINFAALNFVLLTFTAVIITYKQKFSPIPFLIIFMIFPLSYWSFINNQLNYLILFIYGVIYLLLKNNKFLPAGVVSALLLLKPHLVSLWIFYALYALYKNKFKHYLFGLIPAGLVFVGANYLFVKDWGYWLNYVKYVPFTEKVEFGTSFDNAKTFFHLLATLGIPNNISGILTTLALFLISVFLFKYLKLLSFDLFFLISSYISLFFWFHAHPHDYIIVTIPYFLVLYNHWKKSHVLSPITYNLLLSLPLIVYISQGYLRFLDFVLVFLIVIMEIRSIERKTQNTF